MEIFRGRRLWIEKMAIPLPNGITREKVIVHPGNAVAIFPIDGDRCKLLKQYRYAVGQHIYEAPAGTMEEGEDPLETAHRELIEETGFRAKTIVPKGSSTRLRGLLMKRSSSFSPVTFHPRMSTGKTRTRLLRWSMSQHAISPK